MIDGKERLIHKGDRGGEYYITKDKNKKTKKVYIPSIKN